ncbi:single-stranded DNA-binding protein, partial [Subtercola boreus]
MNTPDTESDDYRAGFLAGHASRQGEIDALDDVADRLYRKAFGDERRIPGDLTTKAELEQRRQLVEPPTEVTRAAALVSWGLTDETASEQPPADTAAPGETPPAVVVKTNRTNRTSRRRLMSTRTIVGNLAADPQAVQAGRVQIVKLRVVQDTGEYRQGGWVAHDDATTHFVEAKFQLGENILATLHKGDAVIVVGYEHTVSWGEGENKRYGRVIDADA